MCANNTFDNLECTVSEIFAKIVETGSIDHTKAVQNISEMVYHQNVLLAHIKPPPNNTYFGL